MRARQGRVFVLLIIVLLMSAAIAAQTEPSATSPSSQPASLATAPATAPGPDRYARQLAGECDRLIELAVKKQYGWAWTASTEQLDSASASPRVNGNPRAPVVAMSKRQS